MKKTEINRFLEMENFVKVVELGSFTTAAHYYQKSPSALSKLITRLEARLNIRLFNRSTRGLQITEEGSIFYEYCIRLLSDVDEAERSILAQHIPAGQLKISANIPFGRRFLLDLIPEFMKQYPKISLDISLTDQMIDLMGENVDVAIRSGPLKNSALIARKLGETRMIVVGSSEYLSQQGIPKNPNDLLHHHLLQFNFARMQKEWPFVHRGHSINIKPNNIHVKVSDGDAMRELALKGVGLARLAYFQVKEDIIAGRLIAVLEKFNRHDMLPFYAVFMGHGGFLPARIRAFIDFLVAKVKF